MEYMKRAATAPEDQDREIRATVERMLGGIATRGEAQRGSLHEDFPDQGWDFDVYDQKRYD